jgi:hypothetical protein
MKYVIFIQESPSWYGKWSFSFDNTTYPELFHTSAHFTEQFPEIKYMSWAHKLSPSLGIS